MKVKALTSFSGLVTMYSGEIADISDGEVLKDLLAAKYVEKVEVKATKKAVKSVENK